MKNLLHALFLCIMTGLWPHDVIAEAIPDVIVDPSVLQDPRTRDEDISHTVITVNWEMLSDGNYAYNYSIETLPENKGIVELFSIDISCDAPSQEPLGYPQFKTFSGDGKYTMIGTDDPNHENIHGPKVTRDNRVQWLVGSPPEMFRTGARIISKEAPVARSYALRPAWESVNWDYATYGDDPASRWVDDFIVTGNTYGPRCSTDTSPIPDDPNTLPDDGGDGDGDGSGDGGTDCNRPGQGNAYGLESGKGHEISKGKHLGHDHNCE